MEHAITFLVAMGIPSAITGFLIWLLKRDIEKREAKRFEEEKRKEAMREERERNTEQLMLLTLQNTRAINVLATATAKAVQRIPDAHCNGDMTSALQQAAEIQNREKDFMFDQGIKHIFGDS